jgi:hypothetical protein
LVNRSLKNLASTRFLSAWSHLFAIGIAEIVWQTALVGNISPVATDEKPKDLVRQAGAPVELPVIELIWFCLNAGDQVGKGSRKGSGQGSHKEGVTQGRGRKEGSEGVKPLLDSFCCEMELKK